MERRAVFAEMEPKEVSSMVGEPPMPSKAAWSSHFVLASAGVLSYVASFPAPAFIVLHGFLWGVAAEVGGFAKRYSGTWHTTPA